VNLVVGASGYLGGLICKELIKSGKPVKAMVRSTSNISYLDQLGVDIIEGDLDIPESLPNALKGCDTVFFTASTALPSKKGETMADDGERVARMIDAAVEAGVKHFIYISAAIPKGVDVALVTCKAIGENKLKSSGLNYTILRAGAFMEVHFALLGSSIPTVEVEPGLRHSLHRPWDFGVNYYQRIKNDIEGKGIANVNGKGKGKMSYVATKDIARVAVACLDKPECINATFEIGSENLTYLEAVEVYSKVLGRPLKVKKTPVFLLKLISRIISKKEPAGSQLLKAIAALATIDASLDTSFFKEIFPDFHLQTPEQFLLERVNRIN